MNWEPCPQRQEPSEPGKSQHLLFFHVPQGLFLIHGLHVRSKLCWQLRRPYNMFLPRNFCPPQTFDPSEASHVKSQHLPFIQLLQRLVLPHDCSNLFWQVVDPYNFFLLKKFFPVHTALPILGKSHVYLQHFLFIHDGACRRRLQYLATRSSHFVPPQSLLAPRNSPSPQRQCAFWS